ncbi:hypothetical protein HID58_033214, partial [Brassica napus]
VFSFGFMFNSLSDTIILELFVPEAVIVVSGLNWKTSDSVSIHVLMEKQKENDSSTGKMVLDAVTFQLMLFTSSLRITILRKAKEKEFHVIDLSGGGEESDNGQRICRICHFGSDQYSDRVSGKSVSVDLIEIGCKCKNELGLSHFHCVEAWFKLRGNSSSALNVPVRLTEEEWSEIRDTTTGEGRRRGSGQSCCIFMVFLLTSQPFGPEYLDFAR